MIHQSLPPLYSWKEIKGRFLLLASEEQAQQTLTRFYRQLSKDEKTINHWAYGNTIKFSFFIRHAITFFNEANHSVLMIKPLLLFYGLTNFKKALLLLYDPDYPKTSRVLQHGLTTRKKKKIAYRFADDEIKIQREGLLPYFAKQVLHQPLTINAKYKVIKLLSQCSPLKSSLRLVYQEEKLTGTEDPLHPLLTYHMLMYCLSMLCRYDTETWGELLDPFLSPERHIIDQFLELVSHQYPYLILKHITSTAEQIDQ